MQKLIILIFSLLCFSCSSKKNIEKVKATSNLEVNEIRLASMDLHEYLHSISGKSKKENHNFNLTLLTYDTSLPVNIDTGKHPILSELKIEGEITSEESEAESKEVKSIISEKEEENTEIKQLTEQESEKEKIITPQKRGFIWYSGLFSCLFIIFMLIYHILKPGILKNLWERLTKDLKKSK